MEVLNGTIEVGDKVAVAVSNKRYGGAMRVGTVVGIDGNSVKVRIEKTSGYSFSKDGTYTKTYAYPKRIVKLASAPQRPSEMSCTSATTQLSGRAATRYSSVALRMGARIGFTS